MFIRALAFLLYREIKMKLIKQFKDLDNLNISSTIRKQLKEELLKPFNGNEKQTSDFWTEVGTSLILIEKSDTEGSLVKESQQIKELIQFILEYPEYVLLLTDKKGDYLLALSILNDEGCGCYLLMPKNHQSKISIKLISRI